MSYNSQVYGFTESNIPGSVPAELTYYTFYNTDGIDSHSEIDTALADVQVSVAKCIAGNLCRYLTSRQIGRNWSKEQCSVYELIDMYRALNDPCHSSDDMHDILCKINTYCFCKDMCGCSDTVTLNPPIPERQPEVGSGSGSGSGK